MSGISYNIKRIFISFQTHFSVLKIEQVFKITHRFSIQQMIVQFFKNIIIDVPINKAVCGEIHIKILKD